MSRFHVSSTCASGNLYCFDNRDAPNSNIWARPREMVNVISDLFMHLRIDILNVFETYRVTLTTPFVLNVNQLMSTNDKLKIAKS